LPRQPCLDGLPGEAHILSEAHNRQRIFVAKTRAFAGFFSHPTFPNRESRGQFRGSQERGRRRRTRLIRRKRRVFSGIFGFAFIVNLASSVQTSCNVRLKSSVSSGMEVSNWYVAQYSPKSPASLALWVGWLIKPSPSS
jgi:hypothetical protein